MGDEAKKAHGGRRRASITWDEPTIAEHDKERGTRMKIDEPDTPYHHYDSEDDADFKGEGKQLEHHLDSLHDKLCEEGKKQEAEEERLAKHEAFVEKRKHHYNEGEMMLRMKAQMMQDEDDDDEEEKKR